MLSQSFRIEFHLKRTDSGFNRKDKDDHECEGFPRTVYYVMSGRRWSNEADGENNSLMWFQI